jgi:putative Mn2+ efflux pump MntP
MLYFTVITILFFLAAQVFAVAIGIDFKTSRYQTLWFAMILAIGQALLFWLGFTLGNLFMHLMDSFKSFVIFAALFLIAIRMLMESFQVWKGARIYILDNLRTVQIAGISQGINTFLAGLLFVFLPFEKLQLSLFIFVFALFFSFIGIPSPPKKKSITFAALLFVIGGIFIIISSVYLGFFA